ncbi:MAG: glycerol-3-phosphate acyltransferase [Actinomycetota bacterium]
MPRRRGPSATPSRFGRRGHVAAAVVVGYVIGTFPTADLVASRVSGADLRSSGTGNPGAANAAQVLGARAGAAVLLGDIAKGVAASVLGRSVGASAGAHLAGSAAVAGHCYPVWSGFRGGKGVATSVGQCLATFPAYFPIDVAVACATAAVPRWTQRAFAATTVSSLCWIAGGVVWWRRGLANAWGPTPSALLPLSAALSSAMIVQRFVASGPVGPPADRGPAR